MSVRRPRCDLHGLRTQLGGLSMWVIYDRPRDFPEQAVARLWDCNAAGSRPTINMILAPSLDELRRRLPPGLACVDRHPEDDPAIVEVWL